METKDKLATLEDIKAAKDATNDLASLYLFRKSIGAKPTGEGLWEWDVYGTCSYPNGTYSLSVDIETADGRVDEQGAKVITNLNVSIPAIHMQADAKGNFPITKVVSSDQVSGGIAKIEATLRRGSSGDDFKDVSWTGTWIDTDLISQLSNGVLVADAAPASATASIVDIGVNTVTDDTTGITSHECTAACHGLEPTTEYKLVHEIATTTGGPISVETGESQYCSDMDGNIPSYVMSSSESMPVSIDVKVRRVSDDKLVAHGNRVDLQPLPFGNDVQPRPTAAFDIKLEPEPVAPGTIGTTGMAFFVNGTCSIPNSGPYSLHYKSVIYHAPYGASGTATESVENTVGNIYADGNGKISVVVNDGYEVSERLWFEATLLEALNGDATDMVTVGREVWYNPSAPLDDMWGSIRTAKSNADSAAGTTKMLGLKSNGWSEQLKDISNNLYGLTDLGLELKWVDYTYDDLASALTIGNSFSMLETDYAMQNQLAAICEAIKTRVSTSSARADEFYVETADSIGTVLWVNIYGENITNWAFKFLGKAGSHKTAIPGFFKLYDNDRTDLRLSIFSLDLGKYYLITGVVELEKNTAMPVQITGNANLGNAVPLNVSTPCVMSFNVIKSPSVDITLTGPDSIPSGLYSYSITATGSTPLKSYMGSFTILCENLGTVL